MRIALCTEYPIHQHGGVEALVCALIQSLAPYHEIHLVSADSSERILASEEGLKIRSHYCWTENQPINIQTNGLIEWGKEHQIECFHFHMGGTYAWNARSWSHCVITQCRKAGFPCLSTNHQALSPFDVSYDPRPLALRLASFLLRWPGKARQLSSVCKEVHVSQHDLKIGQSLFPLQRSKLTQIYHSRLNLPNCPKEERRDGTKIILNLATIAFRKGQHILAEAFASIAPEYPEWSLHLIGYHAESACVDRVRQIARDYCIENRIHMPGSTSNPLELFKSAEIYVQASLLEGLGLSLQEAMLHGCACVGSDTGGIPELIHDQSVGRLFKTGNSSALAQILREWIRDDNLRKKIGGQARASMLSRGMTQDAMANSYHEMYNKKLTLNS